MTIVAPATPRGVVLFGPGAGGDPGRYSSILNAFAGAGYVVLAPTSERFDPRSVSTEQLQSRVEALHDSLKDYGDTELPIVATGHSVGAWAALCLAGAQPWGRDGKPIPVRAESRVKSLLLFAPTVGWFQAPGALDNVSVPLVVHTGTADTITPAATAEVLRSAPVDVNITTHENVGHYDFMTQIPPQFTPTAGLNHLAFLHELGAQITATLT